MKNIKKLIVASLVAVMATSLAGCSLIEKTPEGIAKSKVAKYSNKKITRAELDERMAPIVAYLKQMSGENFESTEDGKKIMKEQRINMLNRMIGEGVLEEKAVELKVMPNDDEVKKYVDQEYKTIKDSFESEEKFKEGLAQSGETEESIKANIKNQLIYNKVYDNVTKDVKVTDEEAKTHYDSNMSSYTEKPNKINAAHILVETEEEAKDIIKRLDAGEDFAKLAKEKGTDGTKDKGGELGWIDYNTESYDKTFMQFAIALQKGNYTKAPVKTQFGYHVIKCLDKEEYPVKKFDTVKEDIKKSLLEEKKNKQWNETAQKWQEEAKIKIYENNLQ
ncbi:MAG: peptidylprolyl isomerase [Clostridium argentinense]|uniref:Foldase protein PrsA n=1 Tax=Clostridium faecium TaxID=2762223 RepID=A0ABR8YQJ9_9CLOT|nr:MULTISPECIES: peptidylprolyl isomerase [Clostridium]MBD8046179.1 peptidylprolyl isomerase [Clostridium faecium]MBS5824073.1 peptidylprolyl isomerase [Clostridium argentinense]MDU1350631.1 peptidylprolyl isomerase [Clostridium argentinense]